MRPYQLATATAVLIVLYALAVPRWVFSRLAREFWRVAKRVDALMEIVADIAEAIE